MLLLSMDSRCVHMTGRNTKPTGQIGPHFENSNGCLINPTGTHHEEEEERVWTKNPAEEPCGALWESRLPNLGFGVGRWAACIMPLISQRSGEELRGWIPCQSLHQLAGACF